VQIHIQTASEGGSSLYQHPKNSFGAVPTLVAARPDESPAFLHGRPSSVQFDLQFNKRPYLRHHDEAEKEDETTIAEAIKLEASAVSLADAERSTVHLSPASVTCSSKGYRQDEYHVAVVFDLTEFEHTATEKLMHAQLVVLTSQLVD
jgi:hypothetical protein